MRLGGFFVLKKKTVVFHTSSDQLLTDKFVLFKLNILIVYVVIYITEVDKHDIIITFRLINSADRPTSAFVVSLKNRNTFCINSNRLY